MTSLDQRPHGNKKKGASMAIIFVLEKLACHLEEKNQEDTNSSPFFIKWGLRSNHLWIEVNPKVQR